MATLTSTKIKNTYDALLKATDNDAIGSVAKQITDGLGNGTPLYISTTQIGIGVTPEATYDLHVYSNAKVGGNLTVTGDLTVEGTTTTIDTQTLTVEDPLIEVASNNTSTDAVDIGWYGKYAPSGTTLYAGLFRDTGDGKFKLFKSLQDAPTTTVNTSGTGYTRADLIIGNLEATQIDLGDDEKIRLGDSQDLEIYHSSSTNQSFIRINGELELRANTLQLKNYAGETYFRGASNGAVRLYYDGSEKFITTSTGITITGDTTTTGSYFADTHFRSSDSNATLSATGGGGIYLRPDGYNQTTSQLFVAASGGDTTIAGTLTVSGTGQSSFAGQVTIPETPVADTDAASKGYVDGLVEGQDTLSEILANGNTTGGENIVFGDSATIGTDDTLIFGAGNDLRIAHNGTDSVIRNYTGGLYIDSDGADRNIHIRNDDGSGSKTDYMVFNGAVGFTINYKLQNFQDNVSATFGNGSDLGIFHNGTNSFIENTGGANGDLYIQQAVDDKDIIFRNDDGSGGLATYMVFDGGSTITTVHKNMRFDDSVKLLLGGGSDLQIYHDGSNSYIREGGTGDLLLRGNNLKLQTYGGADYLTASNGAQIELYYNNSKKFETTAGGTSNTGTLDSTGTITVTGASSNIRVGTDTGKFLAGASNDLQIYHDGSDSYIDDTGTGDLIIKGGNDIIFKDAVGNLLANMNQSDSVELYFGGSKKLETTSTGVTVTGGASFTDNIDIVANNKHIRWVDTYGNWLIEVGDGANNFKIHSQSLAADYLTLEGDGQLNLGEYGSGTFTGTATYRLAVDSSGDVIEIPIGDGAVDGSGAAGQVAVWSDTDTITGYTRFKVYDAGGQIQVTDGTRDIRVNSGYGGTTAMIGTSSSHDLGFMTANSQRVTIDSSGLVGIGTTSPSAKLDVRKSGTTAAQGDTDLLIGDSGAAASTAQVQILGGASGYSNLYFSDTSAYNVGGFIYNHTSNYLATNVNGSERMRIDSSGNVSIGTTNAVNSKLYVANAGVANLIIGYNNTSNNYFDADTQIFRNSSAVERMRIDSSGDIGLGVTDGDIFGRFYGRSVGIGGTGVAKLQINGTSYSGIDLGQSGTRYAEINASSSELGLNTIANIPMIFRTGASATERMRIESDGDVGIGTTSPSQKLHVVGTIYTNTGNFKIDSGYELTWGNGNTSILGNTATGYLDFRTSNSTKMYIDSSGDVGIGTTSPSARLHIDHASNPTELRIGNNTADDVWIQFNTDGNDWSIGTDRSDSNKFKISDYSRVGTNDRLVIDTSGNIGIGTSSPQTYLQIGDYTSNNIDITTYPDVPSEHMIHLSAPETTNRYGAGISFGENSFTAANITVQDAGGNGSLHMLFGTRHTSGIVQERMRITSGGNVGIGTDSPSTKLQVKDSQDSSFDSGISVIRSASSQTGYINMVGGAFNFNAPSGVPIRFRDGGTANVTIDGSGNVGIGTTSPNQALDVNGSINITGGTGRRIYWSNGDMAIHNAGSYAMAFETWTGSALTEKMRITSGGSVGIGETNPTYRLNVKSSNNLMHVQDTSGTSNATFVLFSAPSITPIGGIYRNGSANSIVYSTSSDYRLKEDLQDFNALDLVDNITAYDYKWKDTEQRDYGFVAHELQEVMPNVVTGEKDGEMMQGVDYSKLTPVLLKAIQEQQEIINDLKSRIETLENN